MVGKSNNSSDRAIIIALVASLVVHAFVVMLAFIQSVDTNQDKEIEVTILSPEEQKELQDKASKNAKNIVEQSETRINEEKPTDTKYLSRNDQTVVKQTRAANSGAFNNTPGAMGQADEIVKPQTDVQKRPKKIDIGDLLPKPQIKPKEENFTHQALRGAPSATNDYLPDVETGIQTLLSTREFVYFSYYQRIREKIRVQWEPRIRQKVKKVFAAGRTIASSDDRITKVIIVLNNSGALVKVQVIGESGIHDLDEAAVEAFRAAEPFPNPPSGIVENDGLIRIRWDFILEASNVMPNFDGTVPKRVARD